MLDNIVALAALAPGECGTVSKLEGGARFVGRMAALGFTPGATVRIVRNHGHGPLIVLVLDTQIALGRRQATRVRVRRQSTELAVAGRGT